MLYSVLMFAVQAARYQIMIMFLIAATTCIAVVGSVYVAVLSIMDRQHRLCSEKILPKAAAASGVEHWIQGQAVKVRLQCLPAVTGRLYHFCLAVVCHKMPFQTATYWMSQAHCPCRLQANSEV